MADDVVRDLERLTKPPLRRCIASPYARTVFGDAPCTEGFVRRSYSLGDLAGDRSLAILILGGAGLGNLAFILAPLLFLRHAGAVPLRVFLAAVAAALTLAALTPHLDDLRPLALLPGYFVWLAAYAALLCSVIRCMYERNAAGGVPALRGTSY